MNTFKTLLLSAFIGALSSTIPTTAVNAAEQANAPANPKCIAPDYAGAGQPTWFLGIHPMDDLVSVFCRIQQLPGNIRFNVLFPVTKVNKTWETSFEGGLPPEQIHKIVQSLLPTADGPAADEKGMEFHKVLQNVLELQASEAPNGFTMGFAADHPSAKELVLWEPITLRVRPVVLAGQAFSLSVNLKPSLGMLSLALQKRATDLTFQGWKGRMNTGGFLGSECSYQFPNCRSIPEVATFHTPWIVDNVVLEAYGENMTQSAIAIMNQLASGKMDGKISGPHMNTKSGEGTFSIDSQTYTMTMKAKGSSSGTSAMQILWKGRSGANTYDEQLRKLGEEFRAGSKGTSQADNVPDSLDKL